MTNQKPSTPQGLLGLIRRHPLFWYFLLAFAWTWGWNILGFSVFHLSPKVTELVTIPAPFGPAISAFLLVGLTEGKTGVLRLLRRLVLWRVSFRWYLLMLVCLPLLILLCFLAVPGAMASFHAPAPTFALRYLGGYIVILLLGGPLGEEPGWRGFALPRLQQRWGPLRGSLVLGILWGLWHLSDFFLVPGYNGADGTFFGIISAFVPFVIGVSALAILYTWVFNNTCGSLLLAILLHASFDTAGSMFALFFPSSLSQSLLANVIEESFFVGVALLLIIATRGHLSYKRFLREASPDKGNESHDGPALRELS